MAIKWPLMDCGKHAVPTNPGDPSDILWNLEYGINIYSKAWDGKLVLNMDQDLSNTNIKLTCCNMVSMPSKEMKWEGGTLQLNEPEHLNVFVFNERNLNIRILFLCSIKGIPATPQHSDSHPRTSRPLGGHEWSTTARWAKFIRALFPRPPPYILSYWF